MNRIIACSGLAVTLVLIGFSLGFAEAHLGEGSMNHSFQVSIHIFAEGDPSPAAEHLVVFDQNTVYSLPASADQPVTVIDAAGESVILLDRNKRVHTAIRTTDLVSMTARLRASASSEALQERLGINAQVQSDARGHYSVAYGDVQYTTTTQSPIESEWAKQFGCFADWATRLNIAQQRGLPPFGRMLMNSQIAADGRIPLETKLQYSDGEETQRYRSTHQVAAEISHAGRRQISQVTHLLALSKEVPLTDFLK